MRKILLVGILLIAVLFVGCTVKKVDSKDDDLKESEESDTKRSKRKRAESAVKVIAADLAEEDPGLMNHRYYFFFDDCAFCYDDGKLEKLDSNAAVVLEEYFEMLSEEAQDDLGALGVEVYRYRKSMY